MNAMPQSGTRAIVRDGRSRSAPRRLGALLLLQTLMTAVTGSILVADPAAIPSAFGLVVTPDAYLICYFYAATEAALAYLSIAALRTPVRSTRQELVRYFIIVHALEGALGIYAIARGLPVTIVGNSLAHFSIAGLFIVFRLGDRSPTIHEEMEEL